MLKRDAAAKASSGGKPKMASTSAHAPAKQRFVKPPSKDKMPVNFVEPEEPNYDTENSDADAQDFQRGRV